MTDAHTQADVPSAAESYLRDVQAQMIAPPTLKDLGWLAIGCDEYLRYLGDGQPALVSAFQETLEVLQTAVRDFETFYRTYPIIPRVIDPIASRGTIHLSGSCTVEQLREVVTCCASLRTRQTTPAVVSGHIELVLAAAQQGLARKLGHPEIFVELAWELAAWPGQNVTLVLSLYDLWWLYWMAQILPAEGIDRLCGLWQDSPLEANELSLFGVTDDRRAGPPSWRDYVNDEEPPRIEPREVFPGWLKRDLLLQLKGQRSLSQVEALVRLTYALVTAEAITYTQAAELAAVVLGRGVGVDAWIKRIVRWADEHKLPKPDRRGRPRLQEPEAWPVVRLNTVLFR